MAKCAAITEVYSRVCGYFRPVANWNKGKKEEFKDRRNYKPDNNHERHEQDTSRVRPGAK
jgi:ribonucleoside-triphosphate reductase